MKKKLILILITLASFVLLSGQMKPATYTVITTPPAPSYLSLVHYSFDGDATDATGNGNTALTNSMAYGVDAPAAGSGYGDFSTSTPEFRTPAPVLLTSTFFMSIWFRQSTTGGFHEFVDPNGENGDFEHFYIWARSDNGAFEFRGFETGTSNVDIANTLTSVWTSAYVWNHLVVTYDGTGANGIVTFFYNGSEATMSNNTTWNAANMLIVNMIRIGEGFEGHIDELSIGDFIPDGAQKLLMWNGGTPGYIL